MRTEVTVRCIGIGGVGCGASVDPERGGAWCRRHRPLDLTGGVLPWEGLGASERPVAGHLARPSLRPVEEVAELLVSDDETLLTVEGWTKVVSRYRREVGWRDPKTAALIRDVREAAARARRRVKRAAEGKQMGGAVSRVSDVQARAWARAYESGRSTIEIAEESRAHAGTVRAHLLRLGVQMRSTGHRSQTA